MGRKTWTEKLDNGRTTKLVVLSKPFCGAAAGSVMLVSTPREVEAYIRAIPAGTTVSATTLRDDLAALHGAQVTCPTSTGIFLRIVAEAALEQVAAGAEWKEVAPFWRAIEPDSATAQKLSSGTGPEFIRRMRSEEAYSRESRAVAGC